MASGSEAEAATTAALQLERRAKVAAELLATERSYCATLTQLVMEFLLPIRGEGLLKAADVEAVFSNIEEIQNLHMPVLHDLEVVLKHWEDAACIGAAFARLVPYLKLYKAYCANYHTAISRLDAKLENSHKLQVFVQQQRDSGRDLCSMLIQPIQRIPRYRLLFGELVKFTPASHADFQATTECLHKIEEIAVYVNESVRERDNQAKLVMIQSSLTGSKLPELVKPYRKFLKEGVLVKLCRKIPKRRYFFLFNDLLVYTTASDEKTDGKTYAFHRSLDLNHVKVSALDDSGKLSNAFQVYSNQKSFTVFAESPEDKEEWMEAINEAIELCHELQQSMKVVALDRDHSKKSLQPQQQEDGGVAPVWVPDKLLKNCMLCDVKFTTLNRRHHCRKCGKLVCNSCSGKKFKLPNIGKTCRVCDLCYSELTGEPLLAEKNKGKGKGKAKEKERRESAGSASPDLERAELSLAKRATQKFRAESARPASGIGPYREQLSAPRRKPQSLVMSSPLHSDPDSETTDTAKDSGEAIAVNSSSSRDSALAPEADIAKRKHRKHRRKEKEKDNEKDREKDKDKEKERERRRRKRRKEKKLKKSMAVAIAGTQEAGEERDEECPTGASVESFSRAGNAADKAAEEDIGMEEEEEEEESFGDDEAGNEEDDEEDDEEEVVVVHVEEPAYAPPPPPQRNADGFFDFESEEEEEEEELAPPARAPPPPPPCAEGEEE